MSSNSPLHSWILNKVYQVFPLPVKQAWITFIMEAYIELLIACLISFQMLQIRKVWNGWDKFAVGCHAIGLVTVIGFYIWVCWFARFKSQPLIQKKKLERKELFKEKID